MTTGMRRALLFLYAETPVHAGADTGLGALDLPIQREVSTSLPIIKGESLKGALREHLRPILDDATWKKMFGSPPPRSGLAAGTLTPGDLRVHEAQLVAFPAPTLDGFAWVTSPLVRARLDRRIALANLTWVPRAQGDQVTSAPADAAAEDDGSSCLMTDTRSKGSKKPRTTSVVLGTYSFTAVGDVAFKQWMAALADAAVPDLAEHAYFRGKLARDSYQVPDEALTAITRECTAVVARVQLGAEIDGQPTKTVQHGPFYSEYLPSETLLVALLESPSADHIDSLTATLGNEVLQVGGDESIGKGLMWCRIAQAGAPTAAPAQDATNGTSS